MGLCGVKEAIAPSIASRDKDYVLLTSSWTEPMSSQLSRVPLAGPSLISGIAAVTNGVIHFGNFRCQSTYMHSSWEFPNWANRLLFWHVSTSHRRRGIYAQSHKGARATPHRRHKPSYGGPLESKVPNSKICPQKLKLWMCTHNCNFTINVADVPFWIDKGNNTLVLASKVQYRN